MSKVWQVTPWLSRLVLLAATTLFTIVSVRTISNPVGTAATMKIALTSESAITDMRVGFGAFPLAFAIIILVCLVSPRRQVTGLYLLVTLIAVITAARALGIVLDGPAPASVRLLKPEVVLLTLSGLSLALELRRRSTLLQQSATQEA